MNLLLCSPATQGKKCRHQQEFLRGNWSAHVSWKFVSVEDIDVERIQSRQSARLTHTKSRVCWRQWKYFCCFDHNIATQEVTLLFLCDRQREPVPLIAGKMTFKERGIFLHDPLEFLVRSNDARTNRAKFKRRAYYYLCWMRKIHWAHRGSVIKYEIFPTMQHLTVTDLFLCEQPGLITFRVRLAHHRRLL